MNNENKILSDITVHMKYARYLEEEKRRENWEELCERNMSMHIQKFPELEAEIKNAYQYVLDKKVLPSMRSMQFAGKPIEVSPNRVFNCAYCPVDNQKVFSEIMFLLLGGTGVGFSVQTHHVEKLPEIKRPNQKRTKRFLVGDSIEGWADAIHALMKSFFKGSSKVRFDFSDIRPKGARLVTSGGKAPGPQPLKECLVKMEGILEQKEDGEQLTSLEVHDLVCHIADAVLAGGIRRAALISLFSVDDEAMLGAKSGKWYETNPQRGRANNSVVLMRNRITKEKFDDIWDRVKASGAGEPGFYFTNDAEYGANPCCEISLRPFQFCNLTEVNVSDVETQEEYVARAKAATLIGTLQASYTDFHYSLD
jgi:ribonucleoside-triphosphate reductase